MKKEILDCLTWFANRMTEIQQYSAHWGEEYSKKYFDETMKKFQEELAMYVNWNEITHDEAKDMRFLSFSKTEYPGKMCIPLYLFPVLPKGFEVTCIDGEKVVNDGTNLDNDIRCGCVAYMIDVVGSENKESAETAETEKSE